MNVFISGGCKNGKSLCAQKMARDMAAKSGRALYYVATMIPSDDEDMARIRRHRKDREGEGFITLERGRDILGVLTREVDRGGVFVLDSVTALLFNEMFPPDGTLDLSAGERLAEELTDFAAETGNTLFISDYIFSEAKLFDDYTENYRRALAAIDRKLASVCGRVIEVSFGIIRNYGRDQ